jgi:hypothetical protein
MSDLVKQIVEPSEPRWLLDRVNHLKSQRLRVEGVFNRIKAELAETEEQLIKLDRDIARLEIWLAEKGGKKF